MAVAMTRAFALDWFSRPLRLMGQKENCWIRLDETDRPGFHFAMANRRENLDVAGTQDPEYRTLRSIHLRPAAFAHAVEIIGVMPIDSWEVEVRTHSVLFLAKVQCGAVAFDFILPGYAAVDTGLSLQYDDIDPSLN